MSDSDWWCSVVVGGEVPARLAEPAVVKPQHRGQGEQALGDADEHARRGAPAVLLQAELALEGVDDALDPLADAAKLAVKLAVPRWLIGTVGSQHAGAKLAGVAFEVVAGEALIGVDRGPGKPGRRG